MQCLNILKFMGPFHIFPRVFCSGCPEEVREAISSLMFAAARFSDLPELRDLRQIFQDRYGSSLECYVNQEVTLHTLFYFMRILHIYDLHLN